MKTAILTLLITMTIGDLSPSKTFVSCTECPKDIRGFLNIPDNADCDMVKWNLKIDGDGNYVVGTDWGFHINNRTWEKRGAVVDLRGKWTISRDNPGFTKSEIYTLTSGNESLNLLKLNDNMFQLMTKDKKILPGGEGFTNVLNRDNPVADPSVDFELASPTIQPGDMLLSGRTPRKPFDKELGIVDDEDHEKIKWLIRFHADGALEVRRILEHVADYTGRWTASKEKEGVVYQLNFDRHKLYLLKGSDDVYYFITKDNGLVVGDREFGPALIRRPPSVK